MTAGNQIVIPDEIRNNLHLYSGDCIEFVKDKNNNFSIRKYVIRDFWKNFDEHEKKYGSVLTPEIDWGRDIELKDE